MASVNVVHILGNLGKDVELKKLDNGSAVASFPVATSEAWKDKQGNKQESTEWHSVVVWNKQAENCHKYLKKGSKVFVEGQLKTESWEKDGTKHWSTKINARSVKFLDSKSTGDRPQQPPTPQQEPDVPW